jgi:hypothetical protein
MFNGENEMNNKKIIFGSLLTVFLIIMIPIVNAVEYNQVENNIKEKINQVNDKIRIKNIFSSYKLQDIENIIKIINEMENKPDNLCYTCSKKSEMRPLCKNLLEWCINFLLLFLTLSSVMVADYFLIIAGTLFLTAVGIGCKWALIVYILTGFNSDTPLVN